LSENWYVSAISYVTCDTSKLTGAICFGMI